MSFDYDYDIYKLAARGSVRKKGRSEPGPGAERRAARRAVQEQAAALQPGQTVTSQASDPAVQPLPSRKRLGFRARTVALASGAPPDVLAQVQKVKPIPAGIPGPLKRYYHGLLERATRTQLLSRAGMSPTDLGIRETPKKIKLRDPSKSPGRFRGLTIGDFLKKRGIGRDARALVQHEMLDRPRGSSPAPTPTQTREVVKDIAGGGGSTRAGGAAAGGTSNFGRNALIGAGILGLGAGAAYYYNRRSRNK